MAPREGAYRLRPRSLRDERGNRGQRDWTGDGRGATEDSEDYVPPFLVDGLPVEYNCAGVLDAKDSDFSIRLIQFEFDYEVAIFKRGGLSLDENLRRLEWSILWNVANALGLLRCNLDKQNINQPEFRLLQDPAERDAGAREQGRDGEGDAGEGASEKNSEATPYVVMLSSLGRDRRDRDAVECKFLGASADTSCLPMRGVMTAHFTGSQSDEVEAYLLRNVATEMGTRRVLTNDIARVRFLGERGAVTYDTIRGNPGGGRSNRLGLGLGLAISISFVFFAVALFVVRMKLVQDRKRATQEPSEPEPIAADIDSVDSVFTETTASETAAVSDIPVPVENQAPQQPGTQEPPPQVVDGDPDETVVSELSAPIAQRLKPARKKKKKKKPKVLRRVSSRESIKEMETIREEDGEETPVVEYDSEYSTDDEDYPDSSLSSNSRQEASSSWSGSSGSSRSGSKSPGKGGGSRSPIRIAGGSIQYRRPPSPIQEEIKIKRLPPPWV